MEAVVFPVAVVGFTTVLQIEVVSQLGPCLNSAQALVLAASQYPVDLPGKGRQSCF